MGATSAQESPSPLPFPSAPPAPASTLQAPPPLATWQQGPYPGPSTGTPAAFQEPHYNAQQPVNPSGTAYGYPAYAGSAPPPPAAVAVAGAPPVVLSACSCMGPGCSRCMARAGRHMRRHAHKYERYERRYERHVNRMERRQGRWWNPFSTPAPVVVYQGSAQPVPQGPLQPQ